MTAQRYGHLHIDPREAVGRIVSKVRRQLFGPLKRRGLVLGLSGGVDSSVCAALAVRAVGPGRVLGLAMPEADSDRESLELAEEVARWLGIELEVEEITPILEAAGCYARRDAAIRRLVPEYGPDWRCKVVLPGGRLDSDRLNVHYLVVQEPGGEPRRLRLPAAEYREIVAATNFKQRIRKMLEYHHADRLHYAVVGTSNRLELDQGFFVKGGDGLADLKPIGHLYKTQVYQLAEYLGVPAAITSRPPTADTWSLPQTQEEFYFSLPHRELDLVLHAYDSGWRVEEAAEALGLATDQVVRAFREIEQKREAARYLRLSAGMVEQVPLRRIRRERVH